MNEKQFKAKVSAALSSAGFFMFNTHEPHRVGVPDTYACRNGLSIWLELKYNDDGFKLHHPMTMRQSVFLRDINQAGGLGLLVAGSQKHQVRWHVVCQPQTLKEMPEQDPASLEDLIDFLQEASNEFQRP